MKCFDELESPASNLDPPRMPRLKNGQRNNQIRSKAYFPTTMPVTPRRSTRGTVFSPLTPASQSSSTLADDTTFTWTSAPLPSTSQSHEDSNAAGPSKRRADVFDDDDFGQSTKTHYSSFTRITRASAKGRKKNKEEVVKFRVGDGVLVSVEGGDGIGFLTRLWEEPAPKDDDSDDEDKSESGLGGKEKGNGRSYRDRQGSENSEGSDGSEADETRMMCEVHWCFRRKDLPGIMKDIKVEEVSFIPPMRPYSYTSRGRVSQWLMELGDRRTKSCSLHRPLDPLPPLSPYPSFSAPYPSTRSKCTIRNSLQKIRSSRDGRISVKGCFGVPRRSTRALEEVRWVLVPLRTVYTLFELSGQRPVHLPCAQN